MTFEMISVLILACLAVFLFASDKLPVDLVALLIMATLLISGIITPEEGIAGFSNTATVTVGAMFVLSAALFRTGAVNWVGLLLAKVSRRRPRLGLLSMMLFVGLISAFINNTAAVAIFLPVVIGVAHATHINVSKMLMPLSFASMFGGVCTLIGTSTNILVSSIVESHGQPSFSMFEFTYLGLIFFAVGTAYMFFFGVRLIPRRGSGVDLTRKFRLGEYLTEIVLLPNAKSVGKTLAEAPLVHELDIDIMALFRDGEWDVFPNRDTVLAAGDVLRVRCRLEKIRELQGRTGIALKSELKLSQDDISSDQTVVVEAIIAPNSELEGRSLKDVQFRNQFGAMALALRHREQLIREKLATTPLYAGDTLLISVPMQRLEELRQNKAFVFVSEAGLKKFRKKKLVLALAIVTGVVLMAALNIIPIVASSIIGAVLLIVTECLSMEEAYEAIEWRVIFLLAGVLTLGVALEKTGGAVLISDAMLSLVGGWGPTAVLSAIFFLSFMLTNFMSNTATAALLAPIAIAIAQSLELNPRPFLVAVTFAASLSFMTPIGYQTNTMIYGAGQYKFTDFTRVGTPLNLIFWVLATFLIPKFWPF